MILEYLQVAVPLLVLTFRYLVTNNMNLNMFVPYTIGTVCGSVFGVKVSMAIERILHAESDAHLVKK